MKTNWTKVEDGYWKHNSGKYFMTFYNCGEWYGELQDAEGNALGIVAYTKYKADGLKACTKARRVLNAVETIEKFMREHPTYPNDWHWLIEDAN